mmetsp:Transcript_11190/g.35492  ORF Transcript_11190/g.35492 Transcript_11190/m.35492 type:complete len:270 (-) Transcript_11190:436-1245(-)
MGPDVHEHNIARLVGFRDRIGQRLEDGVAVRRAPGPDPVGNEAEGGVGPPGGSDVRRQQVHAEHRSRLRETQARAVGVVASHIHGPQAGNPVEALPDGHELERQKGTEASHGPAPPRPGARRREEGRGRCHDRSGQARSWRAGAGRPPGTPPPCQDTQRAGRLPVPRCKPGPPASKESAWQPKPCRLTLLAKVLRNHGQDGEERPATSACIPGLRDQDLIQCEQRQHERLETPGAEGPLPQDPHHVRQLEAAHQVVHGGLVQDLQHVLL